MLHVDWFVYFGNLPGSLLGFFFVLTSVVYSPPRLRHTVELVTLLLLLEVLGVAGGLALFRANLDTVKMIWGINCNIILMAYYGAPLSAIVTVFRRRSSSSIYWPMSIANLLNGSLWFSYGLWGTKDLWLWFPNGIGAVLAAFQLFLCLIFPRVPVPMSAIADPARIATLPTVVSSDSLAPLVPLPEPSAQQMI
mmetsp:Transcript_9963/g.28575  ORF Transcript_9963/g.28575 Transcript_9963/m.28575 type:complete len:194 (-) Transcript_9963:179-760(-)